MHPSGGGTNPCENPYEQGLAPPERLHPGLDRPPRRGTFEPLVASPLGSVADPLGDLGCLSGDSLDMISGPRTGGTVAEQLRRLDAGLGVTIYAEPANKP